MVVRVTQFLPKQRASAQSRVDVHSAARPSATERDRVCGEAQSPTPAARVAPQGRPPLLEVTAPQTHLPSRHRASTR